MTIDREETPAVQPPTLEQVNTERLDAWKEKFAEHKMEAIFMFGRNPDTGGVIMEIKEGEKLHYIKTLLKDAIKKIDQFNLHKNKHVIIKP